MVKMEARQFLIWVTVVVLVRAQLKCNKDHSYSYQYRQEIKLWGDVQQKFLVSATMDIDCEGVTQLSGKGLPTYNYILHLLNVQIKETSVRQEDALKLCKQSTNPESACGVETDQVSRGTEPEDVTVDDMGLFSSPVRFSQRADGKIIDIRFTEQDLENQDVMNMKRGVLSALQTRVSSDGEEDQEETDSVGSHRTKYRAKATGDGVMVSKKYDKSEGHGPVKVANIQVRGQTLVKDGEIVSSRGEITTKPEDTDDAGDPEDIVAGIEVGDLLQSQSTFTLELKNKRKRSIRRAKRMAEYKKFQFVESTLNIKTEEDPEDAKYQALEMLYARLEQTQLETALEKFLTTSNDVHLQVMKQIILLETELGYDNVRLKLRRMSGPLVDQLFSSSSGVLSTCGDTWITCRELLSLYSLGGGEMVEQVFLYLLSPKSILSDNQRSELIDMAALMAKPSDDYVLAMVQVYETAAEKLDSSSLLLAVGTLSGWDSVSDHAKEVIRTILLDLLKDITPGKCEENDRHLDTLEAVGNMADEKLLNRVIEIGLTCNHSKVIRIAVIHAIRGMVERQDVQDFFSETLQSFDCEVWEEVVQTLIDVMDDQRSRSKSSHSWPLNGLNAFDKFFINFLKDFTNLHCLEKEAKEYYGGKILTDNEAILSELKDVESIQNTSSNIHKRSLKKHSSCSLWSTYSGRYTSIQSASQFASDIRNYNIRKHCLAHFGIGRSKARADLYAGYFAGFNSRATSKNKIFGKLVASGQIFSKRFSIGTVYGYLTQNGIQRSGKMYVRLAGKTFVNKGFTSSINLVSRTYSTSVRFTVFKIPLFITSINVDVTLTARFRITLKLSACSSTDVCLTFTPTVFPRAAAGVSLSLGIIRGGADIGINLNYYVKGQTKVQTSRRKTCVTMSHGHDRNSISVEFWYQSRIQIKIRLWPPWKLKLKIRFGWGKRKTYSPSGLKWSIGRASERRIYSNCPVEPPNVAPPPNVVLPPNVPRSSIVDPERLKGISGIRAKIPY